MASPQKCIDLAQIVGAHGIRGDVKVRFFTDDPHRLLAYSPFETSAGSLRVLSCRLLKAGVMVARLEGISTRNQAEGLKGISLSVERAALKDLEEDAFYQTDLEGLNVIDSRGTCLGTVTGVHNFGAGDLLEVKTPHKSIFLPFTGHELSMDFKAGTITYPDYILEAFLLPGEKGKT
jgi:16S rRNA processing protein RimM